MGICCGDPGRTSLDFAGQRCIEAVTGHCCQTDSVVMIRRKDPEPTPFQPLHRRAGRRTACVKKRYRTESEAIDASKRLRRHGHDGQRAYACTVRNCGGWHLSTQPEFTSPTIGRFLATTAW